MKRAWQTFSGQEQRVQAAMRIAGEIYNDPVLFKSVQEVLKADVSRHDLYFIALVHGIQHALHRIEAGDLIPLRRNN